MFQEKYTIVTICLATTVLMANCDNKESNHEDPCGGVSCSGNGTCVLDNSGQASCDCKTGYHAEGLACIKDVDADTSGGTGDDGGTTGDEGRSAGDDGGALADDGGVPADDGGVPADDGGAISDEVSASDEMLDPCDPAVLRAEALESEPILNGITLTESTPIADILANLDQYEGTLVQIEGLVASLCASAGCWAKLQDPDGNQLLLKVTDWVIDFREVTAVGHYMIGEGIFSQHGSHGPQVNIDDHGAVSGTTVCPLD